MKQVEKAIFLNENPKSHIYQLKVPRLFEGASACGWGAAYFFERLQDVLQKNPQASYNELFSAINQPVKEAEDIVLERFMTAVQKNPTSTLATAGAGYGYTKTNQNIVAEMQGKKKDDALPELRKFLVASSLKIVLFVII